ncbi:MAG: tetratricopeptide repeat protein [Bdellovibrionota bacterium]
MLGLVATVILGTGIALGQTGSLAENSDTRSLLIDKLQKVYLNLSPDDSSRQAISLRLADLYAERARLDAMKDLNSGCTACVAGKLDREKALRLYRQGVEKASESEKYKIWIQIGHLNELSGFESDALKAYEKVTTQQSDQNSLAEGNLSLGEIYFKNRQFHQAQAYYEKVLLIPTASSRGLAAYRVAWCEFSQGQIATALTQIKKVLSVPALQSRNGSAGGQADLQFLEEVSKDFVTFLTRSSITPEAVKELYELTPEKSKLVNLTTLAFETERLGHQKDSLMVWNFVFQKQSQPEARLEIHAHMAALYWSEGQPQEAHKNFQEAIGIWKELNGCGKKDCQETQKVLRQFLVTWNQAEKKEPSENLLKTYQLYVDNFPEDNEIRTWAAQAARQAKNFPLSFLFYRKAVDLHSGVSTDSEKLEMNLLSLIEVAEDSKKSELLQEAQNLYLQRSLKKKKWQEVRYQQAHDIYDQGQYQVAADKLHEIAIDTKAPIQLQKQAADLALDALVLMKNESQIEVWSEEFAKHFKGSQGLEFAFMKQKSILTQVAATAEKNPQESWAILKRFDFSQASEKDRIIYLKNKILLAEKTNHFPDANAAVDELLVQKNLSVEDKEFALGRQAYFSELRLDFATALKATEKLRSSADPQQVLLKMALFADLSGQKSEAYYQQYLSRSKDADINGLIASDLVRKSNQPAKELQLQAKHLRTNVELWGRLHLEIYGKTADEKFLRAALKDEKVLKSAAGKTLFRANTIQLYQLQKEKLATHKLESKNQKLMASSIRVRAKELSKAEVLAQSSIENGDWTSQVLTLHLVAAESKRFYEELLSLPMPDGLNDEEQGQYMNLLSQQATPYKTKAEQALAKVDEFWKNSKWKEYLKTSANEIPELMVLVEKEVQTLAEVASSADATELKSILGPKKILAKLSLRETEEARNELRADPLNKDLMNKLLGIEKQNKNFAMVQYLEGRMKNLEKKETQQ